MKTVPESHMSAMLNPRLAVLVTCCDSKGNPNVLTIAWHTPISHDPPLLGISVAPTRYSHRLIQETGVFAVNVMGCSQVEAANICGSLTGELDDKFAIADLGAHLASKISVPVLDDALGVLECRLEDQVEVGDHTLFIGRVLHAQVNPKYYTKGWDAGHEDGVLMVVQRDRYATFFEDI